MRKYDTPNVDVIYFETEDILTDSGDIGGGTFIPGEGDWD